MNNVLRQKTELGAKERALRAFLQVEETQGIVKRLSGKDGKIDMWKQVFLRMEKNTLVRCSRVCKTWYSWITVAFAPELWKSLISTEVPLGSVLYCKRNHKKKLSVVGNMLVNPILQFVETFETCKPDMDITEFEMDYKNPPHWVLSKELVFAMLQKMPNLKKAVVRWHGNCSEEDIMAIFRHCPYLVSLRLPQLYPSLELPNFLNFLVQNVRFLEQIELSPQAYELESKVWQSFRQKFGQTIQYIGRFNPPTTQFPCLTTLSIGSSVGHVNPINTLITTLKQNETFRHQIQRNLRKISVNESIESMVLLLNAIGGGKYIEEISLEAKISRSLGNSELDLAKAVTRFGRTLKRLTMAHEISIAAFDIIVRYCPLLELFDSEITDNHFPLLAKLPKLSELIFLELPRGVSDQAIAKFLSLKGHQILKFKIHDCSDMIFDAITQNCLRLRYLTIINEVSGSRIHTKEKLMGICSRLMRLQYLELDLELPKEILQMVSSSKFAKNLHTLVVPHLPEGIENDHNAWRSFNEKCTGMFKLCPGSVVSKKRCNCLTS
eukprot:TRINITY_DN1633_c1_g1_i3.p1 TRINITY_DN1633_c1_g1~~TRINITY_DN1633_c1_g1_i3.p1  ORF type:complete len:551 (+),score=42.57 TRINITY_DN1633_c1_g1_i3:150-1802(+)